MDIDWFTFGAQIINFLVLVGLLRWLLYDPIISAMDEREQKITDRLSDADEARHEAEQEQEKYQQKTQELEERSQEILDEAKQQANEERQRLLEQARDESEKRHAAWIESFQRDQRERINETRRAIASMGVVTAREIVAQLADADLQTQMCATFARKLGDFTDEQRQEISAQLSGANRSVVVRSAMNLDEAQQERLREAIRAAQLPHTDVRFETDRQLICGLELDVGGFSFSWNADEFLHEIEHELNKEVRSDLIQFSRSGKS